MREVCFFEFTYNWHLGVTKLVPEILNGVKTNKSRHKQTNKLDTADAANADPGHEKPEEPLRLEAAMTLVVELGPAKDGSDCSAKEHRIEQDESADGGVRVFAKNHESNEPNSRASQLQLAGRVVSHGNADNAEEGIECTHKGIVDIFGVLFTGLEFEGTVIASENSRETNEHLAEGRVDIEVVFVLNIVASELSKAAR